MPLVILMLVLLLPLAFVALVPLSFVLRYRASTARRQARGWVAAINVFALTVSVALFLLTATITSFWIPRALTYTLLGLTGGIAVGFIGVWLSRWEASEHRLHYTPSRALVLAIMMLVASRMAYGLWRAWHAWHSAADKSSWLAASGAAGSLAAGAVVLGYFLSYNAGVWRRLRLHRRTAPPARAWWV